MQTLIFNTVTRTVTVFEGTKSQSSIIYTFVDVPTVKANELYYEVMQETNVDLGDGKRQRQPVARFPISATNMLIEQ